MKILRLITTSGIGDTLWVLTKVQSLLKRENADKAHISICLDNLHRAEKMLLAFDFVSGVDYVNWSAVQTPHTLPDGTYNYSHSQPGWHGYDWLLQANHHLEYGKRLEDWQPDSRGELEINWNVFDSFKWNEEHLEFAVNFRKRIGEYCVFYFGPERGNTIDGHNRGPIWTPQDWKRLSEFIFQSGMKIVAVGAEYDQSYFQKYILPTGLQCENCIGLWEIGKTLAVIKQSEFVIGYQSGIVICPPFMGIKSAGFWRPHNNSTSPKLHVTFDEKMAHCWCPPDVLERGDYLPLIYGRDTPESISAYIKEHWIYDKSTN